MLLRPILATTFTISSQRCALPSSLSSFSTSSNAYETLLNKLSVPIELERSAALLHWDSMVMMPNTDAHHSSRGQMSATLAGVIHEKSTDPAIAELISLAESNPETDPIKSATLRIAKKEFFQSILVSAELQKRRASLSSEAYSRWSKARENNDFSLFESTLSECFATASEVSIAQSKGKGEVKLYTKMLDQFETGMDEDRINQIFVKVQANLVPLIEKVVDSKTPNISCLFGNFQLKDQDILNRKIVEAIGFEGRQDVSVHPFSTSFGPHDVRITSRFNEQEWYQGLAGSIHEVGHGLYEANLDVTPTPLNKALSMGVHESQSLFWERHIGLSKAFYKFAGRLIRDSLKIDASDDEIYRAVNHVKKSLIRVEADELTYPMHVILRMNIERDVVNGVSAVSEIPALWKEGMKRLLDVDVPNDQVGCLQDVHWSSLAFGYFPTYLLGAICAAQLEHYCKLELGHERYDKMVCAGEFEEIREFMKRKIHVHGSKHLSMDDLLRDSVGEELNPDYYLKYLEEKYSDLYEL